MTKILDAVWFMPPYSRALMAHPTIGIVAFVSYEPTGQWKCYIGYGMGVDEKIDAEAVVQFGVPLGSKEAACGFFPQLDPDLFRG